MAPSNAPPGEPLRASRAAGLLLAAAALFGVLLGLGAFTFRYAEGTSYLSTDPAACANCHIMWDQYASWTASSHSGVAGCVDCHLPHGPISKWISKAENGFNHSAAFTLQNYPEPIRIKRRNQEILQKNCVDCHEGLVHGLTPGEERAPSCTRCHYDVGHAAWR